MCASPFTKPPIPNPKPCNSGFRPQRSSRSKKSSRTSSRLRKNALQNWIATAEALSIAQRLRKVSEASGYGCIPVSCLRCLSSTRQNGIYDQLRSFEPSGPSLGCSPAALRSLGPSGVVPLGISDGGSCFGEWFVQPRPPRRLCRKAGHLALVPVPS